MGAVSLGGKQQHTASTTMMQGAQGPGRPSPQVRQTDNTGVVPAGFSGWVGLGVLQAGQAITARGRSGAARPWRPVMPSRASFDVRIRTTII